MHKDDDGSALQLNQPLRHIPIPMSQDTTNVVPFPTQSPTSGLSMVTTRNTALDICHSVYGDAMLPPDAIDEFYESSASEFCMATIRIEKKNQ